MTRSEPQTVHLQVRIREDLRRDLEESARARRVSLNQEVVDRLAYVQERKSLLAEVLRLAFGDRLAGLLLALGLAMAPVATGPQLRRRNNEAQLDWTKDPAMFNDMVHAIIMLLEAVRPEEGGRVGRGYLGRLSARYVMAAMSGDPMPVDRGMVMPTLPAPPAKELEAISELLGPVAQRLRVRHARITGDRELARQIGESIDTMRKTLHPLESKTMPEEK
jgi:hypothetical protein